MSFSGGILSLVLMVAASETSSMGQDCEGGHSEQAVTSAPQHCQSHPASNVGEAAEEEGVEPAISIRLIENVGNGGFPVTTDVPAAQAFFDNGMALAFAFSHNDAINAMAEAVRRDPDCAMCLAGHAYSLGPTLNYGKTLDERGEALALAEMAEKRASEVGTNLEQGFARALVERYRNEGSEEDRDIAYAEAMAELASAYPDHDSIQVLAADARMITDFDNSTHKQAMELLEPVLARSPDHTGAIHFYIHATEIYGEPHLAEAAADQLAAMHLEAGHLVHMPSHTYYWVGRYQEAADANRVAVQIGEHQAMAMDDEDPTAVWGIPYHAHNVIFGLGGAMMADDSRTALMLARPLIARAESREEGSLFGQLLMSSAYFAMGRFESPSTVLELQEPKLPYLKAAWRYARAEAYAFLGNTEAMMAEHGAIPEEIDQSDIEEDRRLAAANQMLTITRAVLQGRLAMMEGRHLEAADAFRIAAETEETEDFSRFSDPPAFWYPVRRDLALALMAAGKNDEALKEAWATLDVRPKDPVALTVISALE